MRRWKAIGLLFLSCLLLTGCWDKVEINDRAFVMGMGIDKFDPEDVKQKKDSDAEVKVPEETPRNRYTIMYSFPNVGLIAGKGEGDPRFLFAGTGWHIVDINNQLSTRINQVLFFGHMKAIILGEELMKDERLMREVLDFIERNPYMGRRLHLMGTPGKATNIMESEPPQRPQVGLFIRDLMRNQERSSRIPDADLGYVLRSLHESKTAVLPRIHASKDQLKIAGAAILKDYQLIGWLGEHENRALMFMLNKIGIADMTAEINGMNVAVHIYSAHTDRKVEVRDGEIYLVLDIQLEAEIAQHLIDVKGQTYDAEYLQKIEEILKEKIEQEVRGVFLEIQKRHGADLVQINEMLRKDEPDLWKEIEKKWEEVYPEVKLDVDVEAEVRRIGTVR